MLKRFACDRLKLKVLQSEHGDILYYNKFYMAFYTNKLHLGVASSIPALTHTFVEIDHEIITTVILLPSADSRRVVVIYKCEYVHEVLVNCFVKLAKEKCVVR